MAGAKGKETIIIKRKNAPDTTVDLAKYLSILRSPVRLKILELIEPEPLEAEAIASSLCEKYGITTTRENTMNHVRKLLMVGMLMKQTGQRDDRPVAKYALVPGSIEIAIRTLSKVMKLDLKLELSNMVAEVREGISEKLSESFAFVRVLGGVDDGRKFLLREDEARIGRTDPENKEKYDPQNDVVLSDEYRAVSRVWKPHAKLILEDGHWSIEHCEGVNETHLWDKKLDKYKKERLRDGDMVSLAEGGKGVRLVFLLPKSKGMVEYQDRIDEYRALLNREAEEPEFQAFFERNPVFLNPHVAQVFPKKPLGGEKIPDFVLALNDKHYILVEIEKPSVRLYNKMGDPTAELTHAEEQVRGYLRWALEDKEYLRKRGLEDLTAHNTTGLLVVGSDLTKEERQKLDTHDNAVRGMFTIKTFSDVLVENEGILKNVRGKSGISQLRV
ncbi:DUF4263 domain-containing protein [Candidatus Bathyarchaeota archaeon]|nr:DUF4263 domain-containing protein [Candidatus Bathyarchaeota archaeon]